jgi:predicted PurR-regulated permease PerM
MQVIQEEGLPRPGGTGRGNPTCAGSLGAVSRAQTSVLILLGLLLASLWLAPSLPLLGFAAMLLATALRIPAVWVARHTGMRRWVAVLALAVSVLVLLAAGTWLASGPLAVQANQLVQDLPRSIAALRESLSGEGIGGWLAERLDPDRLDPGQVLEGAAGGAMRSALTAASGTLGILGNIVLVLLMGFYLALRPHAYLRGLRALFAPELDRQVRAAFEECGRVLQGWLLGQAFSMVATGLMTWLGLMLLGVPLAGVLAVIAALLGFIPYLGPVIAAVPAVLLALTVSPTLALWVIALFVVIQTIEGNILTPLVQFRAADLPPVLLLLVQIPAGALFGLLGVALAAPAAAVGMVLVRRGYVEGWLGRTVPADGEGEPPDEPDAA